MDWWMPVPMPASYLQELRKQIPGIRLWEPGPLMSELPHMGEVFKGGASQQRGELSAGYREGFEHHL